MADRVRLPKKEELVELFRRTLDQLEAESKWPAHGLSAAKVDIHFPEGSGTCLFQVNGPPPGQTFSIRQVKVYLSFDFGGPDRHSPPTIATHDLQDWKEELYDREQFIAGIRETYTDPGPELGEVIGQLEEELEQPARPSP